MKKKSFFDKGTNVFLLIAVIILVFILGVYIIDRWFFYASDCLTKNQGTCYIGWQESGCNEENNGKKTRIYEFSYDCTCHACSCPENTLCDCMSATECKKTR